MSCQAQDDVTTSVSDVTRVENSYRRAGLDPAVGVTHLPGRQTQRPIARAAVGRSFRRSGGPAAGSTRRPESGVWGLADAWQHATRGPPLTQTSSPSLSRSPDAVSKTCAREGLALNETWSPIVAGRATGGHERRCSRAFRRSQRGRADSRRRRDPQRGQRSSSSPRGRPHRRQHPQDVPRPSPHPWRRSARRLSTAATDVPNRTPPSTTVPGMRFIAGLPMKPATKRFCGAMYKSRGAPIC